MTKITIVKYKCNLCDDEHSAIDTFGVVFVTGAGLNLVDPNDEDVHICVRCVCAIAEQAPEYDR